MAERRWRSFAVAASLAAIAAVGGAVWWWTKGAGRSGLARPGRAHILLVTLDAVRADRVGAYGSTAGATPSLDRLATQGVVFVRAYAQSPICLPAHASILTGTTPRRHGIRDDQGFRLAAGVPALAEEVRAAGYRTAAFVSSTLLDRRYGVDRGFDLYEDDLGPVGKVPNRMERSLAAPIVDRALAWLARDPGRPSFLWVHLDEARPPFPPQGDRAAPFANDPGLAALAAVDRELGRLVEGARAARPALLTAVLADHGLSLGEHGEETHGRFLYSATTRVPFVMALPGRIQAGARVEPVVRAIDLAPTVLELAGLPRPPGLEGVSLVRWIDGRGERQGPGPAPLESLALHLRYGLSPLAGLRSGPYLFIRGARRELYDSDQDPGETDDAAARLASEAARLEQSLASWADPVSAPLDATAGEELLRRYQATLDQAARGGRRQAIESYRELLEESPGFRAARQRLSEALVEEGRLAEAEQVLRATVDRGDATEVTYLNLGLALFRLGRVDDALAWLRKGGEALPDSAALAHRTGRLLLQTGHAEQARAELARAVALEGRWLDARLGLAQALAASGRGQEAAQALRDLRALAPDSEEATEAAALEKKTGP